jgi:hypothetical protein
MTQNDDAMTDSYNNLAEILEKARQEDSLDKNEIVFLLGLTQKKKMDAVFEAAGNWRSSVCSRRQLKII